MREIELVVEITSIIHHFQEVIDNSTITKADIMQMMKQNLHDKSTNPDPEKD